MTQDEIIRMANKSGIDIYALGQDREKFVMRIERFAALVAEATKEKAAKVAAEMYAQARADEIVAAIKEMK